MIFDLWPLLELGFPSPKFQAKPGLPEGQQGCFLLSGPSRHLLPWLSERAWSRRWTSREGGGLCLWLPRPVPPLRLSGSLLRGVLTGCHGPCQQNGLRLWPQGIRVRITQGRGRQFFSGSRPAPCEPNAPSEHGRPHSLASSGSHASHTPRLGTAAPGAPLTELSLPAGFAEIGHRSPGRLCDSAGRSPQISPRTQSPLPSTRAGSWPLTPALACGDKGSSHHFLTAWGSGRESLGASRLHRPGHGPVLGPS